MELVVDAAKREYDAQVVTRELERDAAAQKATRDAANDRRDADRWELMRRGTGKRVDLFPFCIARLPREQTRCGGSGSAHVFQTMCERGEK